LSDKVPPCNASPGTIRIRSRLLLDGLEAAWPAYFSACAPRKPMNSLLRAVFNDEPGNTKTKIIAIYAMLLGFNLAAWAWALVAFHRYPVLLGTAFLAYSFGLRHAVDADHIAAIDNVTRKLMQEGKRPVSVGLMFSLGHSTIVIVGSIAIAATALALQHRIDAVREIGGVVGTLVSSLFLFAIAIVNLIVLTSVYRTFTRVRRGGAYVEEDFDLLLGNRGFLTRLFRPIFKMIRRSWHMYPLGVLFGLGFDTATEIGLLGLSAAEASKGLSLWSVLVFPVLFAAGMSLIDSTDNILMLGAYGWASSTTTSPSPPYRWWSPSRSAALRRWGCSPGSSTQKAHSGTSSTRSMATSVSWATASSASLP